LLFIYFFIFVSIHSSFPFVLHSFLSFPHLPRFHSLTLSLSLSLSSLPLSLSCPHLDLVHTLSDVPFQPLFLTSFSQPRSEESRSHIIFLLKSHNLLVWPDAKEWGNSNYWAHHQDLVYPDFDESTRFSGHAFGRMDYHIDYISQNVA
ncbi:hypothetical protein PanWU01x14_328390, partial [Parasponia andersonii]